jgi:hypothetical protein
VGVFFAQPLAATTIAAASTPSENIPLTHRLSFTGALPRAARISQKSSRRHDSIFKSVANVFCIHRSGKQIKTSAVY